MSDYEYHKRKFTTPRGRADRVTVFAPPLTNQEVFRALIADEVQSGQLTASRRRRIIAYAAQLGLTAVQVGEMIAASRDEALQSSDATTRYHALRLVDPPRPIIPTRAKIAFVIAAALAVDWLLIMWLWR